MLSLRGTLTRIIHVFSSEFLNVFTPLLRRRPRSLTFALWMPPTDGLRGRMQIRSDALLESLQWINCTDISYPFSCCSILGKKGTSSCGDSDYAGGVVWIPFLHFLKKVPIYFRCLEECCNAGLLWSSKKNKKKTLSLCSFVFHRAWISQENEGLLANNQVGSLAPFLSSFKSPF